MTTHNSPSNEFLDLLGLLTEGRISPSETERLETLLWADPANRSHYVDYMLLVSGLYRTRRISDAQLEVPATAEAGSAGTKLFNTPQVAQTPVLVTNVLNHPASLFISGWPVAYLIATVVVSIGIAIAAITHVSPPEPRQLVQQPDSLPSSHSPLPSAVGRITSMVDCVWEGSGENGHKAIKSSVALGDRLAISSGLLEVTYNTGAKVILQGPVTYEVESKNGGFMLIGKLTGKVTTEAARGLTIRTPTATVTDLGTEFGVETDAEGNSFCTVFVGSVEIQSTAAKGKNTKNAKNAQERLQLRANESARITTSGTAKLSGGNVTKTVFVRNCDAITAVKPLRHGLVAYWSFDDAGNLGKNSTGGGDLTPLGSPAYEPAGVIGGALRVDRDVNKDSLLYNNGRGLPKGVPSGNVSYSISVWCRVDRIPLRGSFDVVGWGEPALSRANALFLYCNESPDKCMVRNYWWDNDNFGIVDIAALTGPWRHFVATYEHHGRMRYLYLDGTRIGLQAVEKRPDIGANNFAIGHRHLSPGPRLECVGGMVDEVGIWNRELSEPEISQLYNNGKGLNPLSVETVENKSAHTTLNNIQTREGTNVEKQP